ncbi:hypothetical protein ZIOFF_065155 [Zingiber officinale]|uniref:Uncharacterized protein n=1 Tax=Zingiber officinale TaxID=94328 RepID=A0A8J5EWT1_ZINOF|nr:hypothetical protein ZIOFF_065155 [Zingiber officinale]
MKSQLLVRQLALAPLNSPLFPVREGLDENCNKKEEALELCGGYNERCLSFTAVQAVDTHLVMELVSISLFFTNSFPKSYHGNHEPKELWEWCENYRGKELGVPRMVQVEVEDNEEDESEEESDDSEDGTEKKKGILDISEIQNPNLIKPKNVKARTADVENTPELSRRESILSELIKGEVGRFMMDVVDVVWTFQHDLFHWAIIHFASFTSHISCIVVLYLNLYETSYWRATLDFIHGENIVPSDGNERLALIRQQRAEAAKKREEEKTAIHPTSRSTQILPGNSTIFKLSVGFLKNRRGSKLASDNDALK